MMEVPQITIYTDGACSGNPGKGGWGAVLIAKNSKGEYSKNISGYLDHTTNNAMELLATIKALQELKVYCKVDLFTDSSYVKNGITDWIIKWQKNNWKTANNKPVANQELWIQLLEETKKHQVEWHWVKGHAGNQLNELADRLATQAIKENR